MLFFSWRKMNNQAIPRQAFPQIANSRPMRRGFVESVPAASSLRRSSASFPLQMCPSAYFNHSYNTPAGEGARDALAELVTAVLISGLFRGFFFCYCRRRRPSCALAVKQKKNDSNCTILKKKNKKSLPMQTRVCHLDK